MQDLAKAADSKIITDNPHDKFFTEKNPDWRKVRSVSVDLSLSM